MIRFALRIVAGSAGLGMLGVVAACTSPVAPPSDAQSGHAPYYARTAWSTLHGDSRNSDRVPFVVPARSRVVWEALDGAALFAGPTIGPEGHIYATSGRGANTSHLHAFDRNGRLLWESAAMQSTADLDYGAVINAPVVGADGHVYVGDLDQLWSFSASGKCAGRRACARRGPRATS